MYFHSILQTRESGLYGYWSEKAFNHLGDINSKLFDPNIDSNHVKYESISMRHMVGLFYIYGICIIMSIIIIILEFSILTVIRL